MESWESGSDSSRVTAPSGSASTSQRTRLRVAHKVSQFFESHAFKGSGLGKKALVKILAPKPKGPTLLRTRYGFYLVVDPTTDDVIETVLYYTGTYEAGLLHVMGMCLREGDTFVDVGSNIGLMSLHASWLVGETGLVLSFEPEPDSYKLLLRNLDLNSATNVRPYGVALGSSKGKAMIYGKGPNRGGASLLEPSVPHPPGEEVPVETLDGLLGLSETNAIRMMKVDVEGYELEVLRGAKSILGRPSAPILCIEYVGNRPGVLDIYRYVLAVNDYRIFKLRKGSENVSELVQVMGEGDLPYRDEIFCLLRVHMRSLPRGLFSSRPT